MTRFAGGPAESPGFLLWRATMRWQRMITATLAPFELTHVQFVLLACAWWVSETGDPPNQVQLATQAGVDVKMASEVIRRLEAKGLLVRTHDPNDARSKVIKLTKGGVSTARRAVTAVEGADQSLFATVNQGQLVKVLTTLSAIESQ